MSKKFFYRVLEGDSVLSISKKFSVPVCQIIKQNNLTCEVLSGDILYIEENCGQVYSVKPFDTLLSIAKRFNTPKERLMDKNDIEYVFYGLDILV